MTFAEALAKLRARGWLADDGTLCALGLPQDLELIVIYLRGTAR